jgi:hypothetical protein
LGNPTTAATRANYDKRGYIQIEVREAKDRVRLAEINERATEELKGYDSSRWVGNQGKFKENTPAADHGWAVTVKQLRNGKAGYTGERLTRACTEEEHEAIDRALTRAASDAMGVELVFMHAVLVACNKAGRGLMHWDHSLSDLEWTNGQPTGARQPISALMALTPKSAGTVVIEGSHDDKGSMGPVKKLVQRPGTWTLMNSRLLHAATESRKSRVIAFVYLLERPTWNATNKDEPWKDEVHFTKPTRVEDSKWHEIFYVKDGEPGSVIGAQHEPIQSILDRIQSQTGGNVATIDKDKLRGHNEWQIGEAGAKATRPIKLITANPTPRANATPERKERTDEPTVEVIIQADNKKQFPLGVRRSMTGAALKKSIVNRTGLRLEGLSLRIGTVTIQDNEPLSKTDFRAAATVTAEYKPILGAGRRQGKKRRLDGDKTKRPTRRPKATPWSSSRP